MLAAQSFLPPTTYGFKPSLAKRNLAKRNLPILAAAIGLLLCGAPATSSAATTYYGENWWYINDGLVVSQWFINGNNFNTGWANTTVNSTTSMSMRWDISQYGFVLGVGKHDINKWINNCNPWAVATNTHQTISWRSGSDANTGLYGTLNHDLNTSAGIEYYIVEDWMGVKPNPLNGVAGNLKGQIYLDGGTYDVYYTSPSWGPFHQWWSIRRTKRTSGTIQYLQHFIKWKQFGMPESTIEGVQFYAETTGNSSAGEFSYTNFSVNNP
jgi:hypothetical protein